MEPTVCWWRRADWLPPARFAGAREVVIPTRGMIGRTLCARARAGADAPGAAIALYVNGAGADQFRHFDGAAARLGWIETMPSCCERTLAYVARFVDGFACNDATIRDHCRELLPWLPDSRWFVLPDAVDLPAATLAVAGRARPRLVIGLPAPLRRRPERLDRIGPLLRLLDATGVDYAVEACADPPAPGAPAACAGHPRLRWLGTDRAAFGAALAHWRYALWLGDFGGVPPALAEVCAAGVVPLLPRFSWQHQPPMGLPEGIFYEVAELADAVRLLGQPTAAYQVLHRTVLAAAAPLRAHTPAWRAAQWAELGGRAKALPAVRRRGAWRLWRFLPWRWYWLCFSWLRFGHFSD
jgi:hypothetical protein